MGYRDDANGFRSDAVWTIWKFWPLMLLIIIVMLLFGWFLQATGIISMNIEREVVQHSRQYTESKQASLQNLYSQYTGLALQIAKAETDGNINVADAAKAQQIALITQMRREATNIPASEVPVEIYRLIH